MTIALDADEEIVALARGGDDFEVIPARKIHNSKRLSPFSHEPRLLHSHGPHSSPGLEKTRVDEGQAARPPELEHLRMERLERRDGDRVACRQTRHPRRAVRSDGEDESLLRPLLNAQY